MYDANYSKNCRIFLRWSYFPAHELGDVARTSFELLGHVELGGEQNVQIGLKGANFAAANDKLSNIWIF